MHVDMPDMLNLLFSYKATPLFFMMSGFLIWGSIAKTKDYKEHCIKRFLRIYPELWVAVLIELIAIFVLYDIINFAEFGLFAITQSTFFQFWTPNTLREYGCGTPNGSLWTICILIQFYFMSYYIYKFLHGSKNWIWILIILISILLSILTSTIKEHLPIIVGKLLGQSMIPYFWIFLFAAFAAEKKNVLIPFVVKYCWYIFALSILIKYMNLDFKAGYHVFFTILMFLFLVGVAYLFPKFDLKIDISYGIYLYHMTVVNIFITFGFLYKPSYLIAVIVITILLSWISSVTIGNWSKKQKECIKF